jgi:hypothetical protein
MKHSVNCPDGPCTHCVVRKFRYHIRQLLPLTYRSHFTTVDGSKHFAVWRMWFGRVFSHEDHIIANS